MNTEIISLYFAVLGLGISPVNHALAQSPTPNPTPPLPATPPQDQGLPYTRSARVMALAKIADCIALCLLSSGAAQAAPNAALSIAGNHPIIVFKDAETTQVTLTAVPLHFTPTSYSWKQVEDRINPLNTSGTATFSANDSKSPTTKVTFSTYGVYELQLTAKDAQQSVTKSTWINVWDSATVLGAKGRLGLNPGITPPTSVRQLSPTPATYQHPRVLFTDADWAENAKRAATGKVAGWGVATIRKEVAETLDNPKHETGQFAAALDAWVSKGMTGPGPDAAILGKTNIMASEARGCFYSMLLDAGYLLWLENDPTKPRADWKPETVERGRYLARLAAGAARLHFNALWDRATGKFNNEDGPLKLNNFDKPGRPTSGPELCDLAMAYDLLYNWMDNAQRQEARDFLFAAGWGRHTSYGGWESQGPDAGKLRLGLNHNGDFGNLNDQTILEALAIEGEEDSVSPAVRAAFGVAAPNAVEARWTRLADANDAAAWPTATVASVDNLQRQMRWIVDWFVTPWGLASNHLAYLGFTAKNMLPSTLALSRRGENLFVTTHLYQAALHPMLVLHEAEGVQISKAGLGESKVIMFDHHDSGSFGQRGTMCILWKYMFPDDPMVDYVWRAYLPTMDRDPLLAAIFGLDPGINIPAQTLPEVAKAKQLPLTVFDPQRSIVAMHSSWANDATSLWFDCGADADSGHMHAEKNSFDFFALGRGWSVAPGYHMTINDLQAAILIKDPRYADDPVSQGYIGESPSSATQRPGFSGNFPTPPGTLLEVSEAPDKTWTLVAGDATLAYTAGFSKKREIDTKRPLSSFIYPGMLDVFTARSPKFKDYFASTLKVSQVDYNPMRHVIRSILFVRGARPYALVVDDCDKDGQPHDWRWTMNACAGFAPGQSPAFLGADGKWAATSLAMQPGATASEAVLYHSPIDDEKTPNQAGLPRLLLRDVGLANGAGQLPIVLERRTPENGLTYGVDNNSKKETRVDSNRVLIERDQVAQPNYKVLLFPYRTGEAMPVTSWNTARTKLTVGLKNGTVDTLTFDNSNPDHRTRISFARKAMGK